MVHVGVEICLAGRNHIRIGMLLEPKGKLADIPDIGRNRIGRGLFHLDEIILIGLNQIQHMQYPLTFP